ncbi:MAG: hypothetical protein K8R69_03395 [Deltaproteobacteria bacterium]|nr:hypothetical protein [Deltaproteobacteria bacterium]
MTAAGLAFRLTRGAVLARLATSPSANYLTRGFGLRASASLAGFGVETLAFTLGGKTAGGWMGQKVDWSAGALSRDWASGALTLGALKVAGALTRFGLRHWVLEENSLERMARALAPQAAMLGGLVLGQGLEESMGWRSPSSFSNRWVDGLATLLHFHVGGRLAGAAFGSGFRGMEQELELRAESHQGPKGFASGPHLAIAGQAGSISTGSFPADSELFGARPMLTLGGAYRGATASDSFKTIKQIESVLAKGRVLLELGTRHAKVTPEIFHHMYTLEDAFTSLLHGYRTVEAGMLKGPLANLVRQDDGLRRVLLDFASSPNKRLWAFVDVDTGELQRVVSLDHQRFPRAILYWNPGLGFGGKRATFSYAARLDFSERPSSHPEMTARLYRWDPKSKSMTEEPAPDSIVRSNPPSEVGTPDRVAEVRAFPSTDHELIYQVFKNSLFRWRLKDPLSRPLFTMRVVSEDGAHSFDFSDKAPPLLLPEVPEIPEKPVHLPTKTGPALAPRKVKPAGRISPAPEIARPVTAPSVVSAEPETVEISSNLRLARQALANLKNADGETPQVTRHSLGSLRYEVRHLSGREMSVFAGELEADIEIFFRLGESGASFLRNELPRMPSGSRLSLCLALADQLASVAPPRRSVTFEIVRDILPKMDLKELDEFQKGLDKKFPPGSLSLDRGMMVQQIRGRIRNLLGLMPSPAKMPPPRR